jgi:Protein of unknown function (DUF3277)
MANTYSFKDVSASLAGPNGTANLGYGAAISEEGITVDMGGDKNTMHIGADGTPMHSLHADKSGTVTIRCLKTSPTNAVLQDMYDAQQLSSIFWGQNVIIVRENQSGDITTAQFCAFKKKPNLKYAKDADVLDWVFDAGTIDTVLGTY